MRKPLNVHGTALQLGAVGLLLRGPSGAGKSMLALALLDRWSLKGEKAFLVADDRVDLMASEQGLFMTAPALLRGQIELRGRGILTRPVQDNVGLHLIVDLVGELVRMPERTQFRTNVGTYFFARAPVPAYGLIPFEHQLLLIEEAILALEGDTVAL